jgi:glycine C-acetyltransferase
MAIDRIEKVLARELEEMGRQGTLKGQEQVITDFYPGAGAEGPRYLLAGEGDRRFLRMNSNSYLGMSLLQEVVEAEAKAARTFGTGPGAVRFISGTYQPHIELERRLAEFHGREACMIFNAMRLARPQEKKIYRHLDLGELDTQLAETAGKCSRAIVVTDGIFSMRGDHAPLPEIMAVARKYDDRFAENVLVVADDSHGVGAFGKTGRGTEEYTGGEQVDLLIATLGKALGVNGGYVVGSQQIVGYLREKSPFYIYSNPITPAEAAAACAAVELLSGSRGRELLDHLRSMTGRFEQGLVDQGFETIPGEHPVVPLMVRDTAKTSAMVEHLFVNGILATGLKFPVVPQGDEEIRFQISADHTAADIDYALQVLAGFKG